MKIGHRVKSGVIELTAPDSHQGIRILDAAGNQKVLLGNLGGGKYGGRFRGAELYSSLFRTGEETDNTYIALTPEGVLEVYYQGKQNLGMWANQNWGNIVFYEDGVAAGQLYAVSEIDPALGGTRRRFAIWSRDTGSLRLYGPGIHLDSSVVLIGSQTTHEVNIFGKFKSNLLPYIDNYGYVGNVDYRWYMVRAVNIQQGDLCFEERTCPICEQPFAPGDAVVLLVRHVHEELGTMTIPVHDRCKDTPKTLTVEIPETEERYRLKEDGNLETYKVTKFEEVEEEVHQVKDDYELDEAAGLFKKKALVVPVAKEGYSARLTSKTVNVFDQYGNTVDLVKPQVLKFYDDQTGQEVELTSILEPVEVFPERPAEKEEAIEVITVRRRRPVMKTVTVEVGGSAGVVASGESSPVE